MTNYKNILIVRTDRIGDVVLTIPVIHVLRKNFPQSRITMLVAPATQGLVQGHPDLDEVLVDDRRDAHRGPLGFVKLIWSLKNRDYDLALIFHTKRRTNLLCFLADIPNRIGYANNKFGFLLTQRLTDHRPFGIKHESQYCLDVLTALGINGQEVQFHLSVSNSAEEWARKFFQTGNIDPKSLIAIHPGASDPTREWPAHRFAELMNQIKERYDSQFVLIGVENTKKTAAAILAKVNFPVADLTGKTTLGQVMGLLKQCRLLISNDSGPVHVADALGIPVISIFTRNQPGINPERWQPLGKHSRVVVTPFNGAISFAKRDPVSPEYLELITSQQVLEAVDDIFKLC